MFEGISAFSCSQACIAQSVEQPARYRKVPSSILGAGHYFHWKLIVTLILYIVHRGLYGRGFLPLMSVYFRFPRNLSISNYSYFIKLNGCCVGKIKCVAGPGFEPGSLGCRFPSFFQC